MLRLGLGLGTRSTAPTGVTPLTIFGGTDLLRWYGENYTASTGVWVDESGHYNTVQSSAGLRPAATTINGHPAADFSNDALLASPNATDVLSGADFTLFAVVVSSSMASNHCIWGKGVRDAYQYTLTNGWVNGPAKGRAGCIVGESAANGAYSDADINDGNPHALVAVMSSGTLRLYVDGTTAAADTVSGAKGTGTDYLCIGSGSNGAAYASGWIGKIGQPGLINRATTAVELAALVSYLKTWAGIP